MISEDEMLNQRQGFTADVSCTFSNDTPPVQADVMRGSGDENEILYLTMNSDCSVAQGSDCESSSLFVRICY